MSESETPDLAALNSALTTLNSLEVSLKLVSEHLAALQRQARAKDLHFTRDGELSGVSWSTSPDKIIPADDLYCIDVKTHCKWLPKYVDKLWENHTKFDLALSALPPRLTQKLDDLTRAPWVVSVRRHCIDNLLKWPGERHHQTSMGALKVYGTVQELLEKAAKDDPFATWSEYLDLMAGYAHDLFSIRDAVATANVTSSDGATTDRKQQRRTVASAAESRDKWIYEQCCIGVPYDTIAIRLKKKPKSWARISTKQGIRAAAVRYAARNHLAAIPARQE